MQGTDPFAALARILQSFVQLEIPYAVVGGFAVSIRSEPRFTRDVDLALAVIDDAATESVIMQLRPYGYSPAQVLEHDVSGRIGTVRLASPNGIIVDLMASSCGIEPEVVARATTASVAGIGDAQVASAEALVAMKVLSYSDRRIHDRADAQKLIQFNPELDLDEVRRLLALIVGRGYARGQDLEAKLRIVLDAA